MDAENSNGFKLDLGFFAAKVTDINTVAEASHSISKSIISGL